MTFGTSGMIIIIKKKKKKRKKESGFSISFFASHIHIILKSLQAVRDMRPHTGYVTPRSARVVMEEIREPVGPTDSFMKH
jgi:hypothetical protein